MHQYHKWLRSFYAVAHKGSFTLAAEYLCIGQPTISEQVKALENVYNIELFHRSGNLIEMTDAGKLAETIMLPRFGMQFAMPGEFSTFEFFGLGPHENYIDRASSALMGHYVQRVEDQYHYGYVRPQESGTKTQIKWMRVLDDNGAGFEITSDVKFSASALPFNWKEMEIGRAHV